MAENQVVGITINVNGTEKVLTSMKDVRGALKEAKSDLLIYTTALGESSKEAINAAQRIKELEDAMGDAAEFAETFNPDKPFSALTGATQGAVAGITAVQGAMGLFGSEGKAVGEVLARVNSAMALQQGVEGIAKSINSFKLLGMKIMESSALMKLNAVATNIATAAQKSFGVATVGTGTAFKILKAAIMATGIVALVAIIGGLVSVVMDWTSSTDDAEKANQKLNEAIDEQNRLYDENRKRLQYAREDAIAEAKIKGQSAEEIYKITQDYNAKDLTAARENEEVKRKMLIDYQKKNLEIFYEGGRQMVRGTEEQVEQYKKLQKELTDAASETSAAQRKITTDDQAERLRIADQERADAKKSSDDAKNKAKQNQQKREQERKEREQAEKDAQKRLRDIENESFLLTLKEGLERNLAKLSQDRENQELEIKNLKATEETKQKLLKALDDKFKLDKKVIEDEDAAKKKEEQATKLKQEQDFQAEVDAIKLQTKLMGMKDEREKTRTEQEAAFQEQLTAILNNAEYTTIQKEEKKAALEEQYRVQKQQREQTYAEEDAIKQLNEIEKIIGDEDAKYQVRIDAVNKEKALIEDLYSKKLITDEEYLTRKKAVTQAEIDIDTKKKEALVANAEKVSSLLGNLSNLFGKQTAAGKTFAIAQAVIDTYLAANKAYQSMSGIPVVGPALGAVAAGAAIASGIKNVKEILKVKTPSGGGTASVPNVSAPAPPPMTPQTPQASLTQLDQQSINRLGSATNRAYVLESDVTNSQERITRINRAARLS